MDYLTQGDLLKPEKFKNIEYIPLRKNKSKAIILFHGYGANMHDLLGLSSYMGEDYDFFFPNGVESLEHMGMYGGRAWFPIDMAELEKAMREGGFRKFANKSSEEFNSSQVQASEFVSHIKKDYEDIVIGGFSQGAMLASHIFADHNPLGLMLMSGTLFDRDQLMLKLDRSRPLSFFQSHGKSDAVLEYSQAMDLFEVMKLYKHNGELISFDGAHEIPMVVMEKAKNYLRQLSS